MTKKEEAEIFADITQLFADGLTFDTSASGLATIQEAQRNERAHYRR